MAGQPRDGRERRRTGTESCPARREKHGSCVCVPCGRGRGREDGGRGVQEVQRSGEDLGNKRTVSGVCRGAAVTHECSRLPLTRVHAHTRTHIRTHTRARSIIPHNITAYHTISQGLYSLTALHFSSTQKESASRGLKNTASFVLSVALLGKLKLMRFCVCFVQMQLVADAPRERS